MKKDLSSVNLASTSKRKASEKLKGQFGPLRTTTLNEEIYDAICSALRDGRLLPGQTVSVRDLAAAVDTSPMPVREALRRLEAQGVIDIKPGRALSVPGLIRSEVHEIYSIRKELEGLAAEWAAQNATQEDIAEVEDAYEAMDACFLSKDIAGFMETNYAFHMSIYRAAHMPRLVQMIEPLWLRISPFLWSLVEMPHLKFSMDQHRDALQCLRARDAVGLRAAIVEDITEAKRKLEDIAE